MREIRFRAWDNVKDKMYYVGEELDVVFTFDSNGIVATDITEGNEEFKTLHYLDYMQWTGLKDKAGKDIYEGDIVNFANNKDVIVARHIKFIDGEFAMYDGKFRRLSLGEVWPNRNIEVIGNLYENPKLVNL